MMQAWFTKGTVRLSFSRVYAVVGQAVRIRVTVSGDDPAELAHLAVHVVTAGMKLGSAVVHGEPGDDPCHPSCMWEWEALPNTAGIVSATARIGGQPVVTDRIPSILAEPAPVIADSDPKERLAPENGGLELRGDQLWWRVPREGDGYPLGHLYVRENGEWRLVSSSNLALRVVTTGPDSPIVLLAKQGETWTDGDRIGMVLQSHGESQGIAWEHPAPARIAVRLAFALERSGSHLQLEYDAKTDRPINLRRLDGPALSLGEDGSEVDEALFPGLEWLVHGEHSSSELDVHGPEHLRVTPHPLKVTWPLMAIRRNHTVISLLWSPDQSWNGEDRGCSAEFASPNRWEGQSGDHLALFVPTVPRYGDANDAVARDVYRWNKSVALRISAWIAVHRDASSVLAALEDYRSLVGIPSAREAPRDYGEVIKLGEQAYRDAFWNAAHKAWEHVHGWVPRLYPSNLALSRIFAQLVGESAGQRLSEISEEAEARMPIDELGRFDGHVAGIEAALTAGGWQQALAALSLHVAKTTEGQEADGNWTFHPETEAQRTLGEEESRAVGLTARKAEQCLLVGRMLQDGALEARGLAGLEAMRRFRVPRAAQVWECPVHSPDILASAHAVDAYLEGYKTSADVRYLEDARYWATTGLPFLYVWDTEDRPVMRWASIAIFGATFFTHSWFGRPVQWNGLVYADAVLRLARYDGSWPWQEIARGILHSALHQQRTIPPAPAGLPDSWYLPDNIAVQGVDINPEAISKVLFRLMGYPTRVCSVTLIVGGRRVALTVIGQAIIAEESDGWAVALQGLADLHRHVLIAGASGVRRATVAYEGHERTIPVVHDRERRLTFMDLGENLPSALMLRIEWSEEDA